MRPRSTSSRSGANSASAEASPQVTSQNFRAKNAHHMNWLEANSDGRPVVVPGGDTPGPLATIADQRFLLATADSWPYVRTPSSSSDGFLTHITGRAGNSLERPKYITDLQPSERLAEISVSESLLACRQFNDRRGWPAACFTGGDARSRAALWTGHSGRYQPWGLAFRRGTLEAWGAREVTYLSAH